MNNYLIYIVICLAILLVIGILLLRKSKSVAPQNPGTPSIPKPQPNQNIAPTVPQAPVEAATLTAADRLTSAQRFLDQQRYDDAIDELKQGLVTYPKNKDLSLKLLNVYAISNRHSDFDAFYDQIQTEGDLATLAEADTIKELVQQERQPSTPIQPSVSETTAHQTATTDDFNDFLDFDTSDDEQSLTKQADLPSDKSLTSEDDLSFNLEGDAFSFDELESQLLSDDTESTSAKEIPSQNQPVAEEDFFELSLDDAASNTQVTADTTPDTDSFSLDLDSDEAFNFDVIDEPSVADSTRVDDEPISTSPAATTTALSSEEDIFSIDTLDDDTQLTTTDHLADKPSDAIITESGIDTDSAFDEAEFDFGLEDDAISLDINEEAPSLEAELLSDDTVTDETILTDGLDITHPSAPEVTTAPVAATPEIVADDDSFDFDFSDAEILTPTQSSSTEIHSTEPAVLPATQQAEPVVDDSVKNESVMTNSEVADFDEAELDFGDDFDFGTEPTVTEDAEDFNLDLDTSEPTTEPTTVSSDLDHSDLQGNNLDNKVLGESVEDTLSQLDAMSMTDMDTQSSDFTPTQAATGAVAAGIVATNALSDDKALNSADQTTTSNLVDQSLNSDSSTYTDQEVFAPVRDEPTAPVSQPTHSESLVIDDSAATKDQFATDFGFVANLDSAQVTLDLATQYMELGEYESAKRLLHEVVEQGNSAQQAQAQDLLSKTV